MDVVTGDVFTAEELTDADIRRLEFMRFLYRGGLIGVGDDYSPMAQQMPHPFSCQCARCGETYTDSD